MTEEGKDFREWAKEHMSFPEDFVREVMADKEPDIDEVAFSVGEDLGKMYAATARGLMSAGVPEEYANKISAALLTGKVLAMARES